uniref:Uncharacterized protein n=1 Tax=Phakopsora pachyrhizi TaxID=170000 RepID=A0A0S1MIU2_PHAPC
MSFGKAVLVIGLLIGSIDLIAASKGAIFDLGNLLTRKLWTS